MLFPSGNPVEETINISPPLFPYLPALPGFTPIVWLGDIPGPADSPSVFDDLQALPGWSPSEHPGPDNPLLGLLLLPSQINSVPSGDSKDCIYASSSVASDDDGDTGVDTWSFVIWIHVAGVGGIGLVFLQCC